ncbi:hypothetical protein [Acinetobacter baumannii]|uniref:hypothetical protein n=1 Tax=Acinetobacter baumannii TaxID=470 RepID=UPI0022EA674D|nr:hypothetical protein [Acinetobacter baumannii]MDA3538957.1 hypothetical protein [Acinetobacter baumannii]MDA3546770.1 hypothetical protein [Acinetobacter baumannii]
MDKQREGFEKAYEPNPNKSPFTEVKFDEVARVYKPLDQFNPRIASSLNAAWYGWRIRQAEVDGLQAKVEELKASHHGEVIGHEVHFKKIKKERDELQTLYIQQGINMLKLQKRVDAALKLIESWNEIAFDKTTHWTEGYEEGCYHCAAQLEQALKGEG